MSQENVDLIRAWWGRFVKGDANLALVDSEIEAVYGYVWQFRAGKVVHLKSYATTEAALAAAALAG